MWGPKKAYKTHLLGNVLHTLEKCFLVYFLMFPQKWGGGETFPRATEVPRPWEAGWAHYILGATSTWNNTPLVSPLSISLYIFKILIHHLKKVGHLVKQCKLGRTRTGSEKLITNPKCLISMLEEEGRTNSGLNNSKIQL